MVSATPLVKGPVGQGTALALAVVLCAAGLPASAAGRAAAQAVGLNVKLAAVSGATDKLDVTWNHVAGSVDYRVFWKPSSDADYRDDASATIPVAGPGLTHVKRRISMLSAGTSYDVLVVARVQVGGRIFHSESMEVSRATPAALGAVTVAAVAGAADKLDVSWADVAGDAGYRVEWKLSADADYSGAHTTAADAASYQVMSLSAGTAYAVRVTALVSNGASTVDGDSAEASGTTLHEMGAIEVLRLPRRVTTMGVLWPAVSGAGFYRLQWRAPSDVGYPHSKTVEAVEGAAGYEAALDHLSPFTTYEVKVTARVSIGGSVVDGDSATASATTFDAMGPLTVAAVPGTFDRLAVSWTDIRGEVGYRVWWRPSTVGSLVPASNHLTAADATSYVITGLEPNTSYDVEVVSVVRGDGLDSAGDSSQASAPTTLSPLSGLSAAPVAGDTSKLSVSWKAFTDAETYLVQHRTLAGGYDDGVAPVAGATSLVLADLAAGAGYAVRVFAVDTDADPDEDLAVNETTATTLHEVGAVTVEPVEGSATGLSAAWAPVEGAHSYRVQWKPAADAGYSNEASLTVTPEDPSPAQSPSPLSSLLTGLAPGTAHHVRVTALVTIAGRAADGDSAEGSGTTLHEMGPVTVRSVSEQPSQLEVSWSPVEGAVGYRVQWKLVADADYTVSRAVSSAAGSLRIGNLSANTAYDVRVTARVHIAGAPADGDSAAGRATTADANVGEPPKKPVGPGGGGPVGPGGGGPGGGGPGGGDPGGAGDDSDDPGSVVVGTAAAQFADVDRAGAHSGSIAALYASEITLGCGVEPLRYCPDRLVTRAQMASFLARALGLSDVARARFTDVDPDGPHSASIAALFASMVTLGCGVEPLRFCPDKLVTRAQMASFLTRALGLSDIARARFTDVDPDGPHSASIAALYASMITLGCAAEPLRYCPNNLVTRAQMASFLARALNLPTTPTPST